MRKVHVNVGTIGHIDHGKTTLTAALLADPDLLELVELETRELLSRYGFDGAAVPFVRGNARAALANPADPAAAACIENLLAALDAHIPDPVRVVDRPFLLAVEGVRVIA